MATKPDFNVEQCVVEWTVLKLPAHRNQNSTSFTFQRTQSSLLFKVGLERNHGLRYSLYITWNENLSLPFDVTVYIVNGRDSIPYQGKTVTNLGECIWRCTNAEILDHIPNFDDQHFFHFRVVFHRSSINASYNLDEALLSRHKCIQTSSYLDREPCLNSLSTDLRKLLTDQVSNPDVRLQCGDCTLPAHRNILGSRSDVFKAMLQTGMAESRTGVVHIADIESSVFKEFLEYLYTGTLPELTVEFALRMYETGDKYAVEALKNRCAQFLKDNVTLENACGFLVLADAHSDQDFKEHIICYIVDNDLPLKCDQWPSFTDRHPKLANEALYRAYKFAKGSTQ